MHYVVDLKTHKELAIAAYRHRGFDADESAEVARFCELTSQHGIHTHHLIKALHLDHLFGSQNKDNQGCVPGAQVDKLPSKFEAVQKWNANRNVNSSWKRSKNIKQR